MMEKLIEVLSRLYLVPGAVTPDALAQQLLGKQAVTLPADAGGRVRALALPFERRRPAGETEHWQHLCEVANALQTELGLPAPAVSIPGDHGYRLWLSFATPLPLARAQRLLDLLRLAYFPDSERTVDAAAPLALPPYLDTRSGKWAAFINPGMGASFAEEAGLEMAPPFGGQAALLEGLESIDEAQLAHALALLEATHGAPTDAAPTPAHAPAPAAAVDAPVTPDGLLLKDATLEDIVRFLHTRNIEPTFRYVMPH